MMEGLQVVEVNATHRMIKHFKIIQDKEHKKIGTRVSHITPQASPDIQCKHD